MDKFWQIIAIIVMFHMINFILRMTRKHGEKKIGLLCFLLPAGITVLMVNCLSEYVGEKTASIISGFSMFIHYWYVINTYEDNDKIWKKEQQEEIDRIQREDYEKNKEFYKW